MYHVLYNCAGAGGNGNGLNMNRKLIYEFFPPPAPWSHANTYRFSLFSTPLLSRRTRPLRQTILLSMYCTYHCPFKRERLYIIEKTALPLFFRKQFPNQPDFAAIYLFILHRSASSCTFLTLHWGPIL